MPPLPGEVPPAERRKAGVYPLHWQPAPRVVELRNRLFEVLSRKHAELKNSFRRFDEDHRGTVDLSELYRVMVEESGIQARRRRRRRRRRRVAWPESGAAPRCIFAEALAGARQCTRRELEELWDFFDRDRDGLVKYSDYAKTMVRAAHAAVRCRRHCACTRRCCARRRILVFSPSSLSLALPLSAPPNPLSL